MSARPQVRREGSEGRAETCHPDTRDDDVGKREDDASMATAGPSRHCGVNRVAERVASTSLRAYNRLSRSSSSPADPCSAASATHEIHNLASHQHTVLAALCAVRRRRGRDARQLADGNGEEDDDKDNDDDDVDEVRLVSLATGNKSLALAHLSPHGDTLHDSHAEVLAKRGARLWVMRTLHAEIAAAANNAPAKASAVHACAQAKVDDTGDGRFFERADTFTTSGQDDDWPPRWRMRRDVELWWYISTLPCGNASSALSDVQQHLSDLEAAGRGHVASVGAALRRHIDLSTPPPMPLRGRLESEHDALRTKPGRADSPPCVSLSCTDKLALAAVVGLEGSLLSHVLSEALFARHVVVGDEAVRAAWLAAASAKTADPDAVEPRGHRDSAASWRTWSEAVRIRAEEALNRRGRVAQAVAAVRAMKRDDAVGDPDVWRLRPSRLYWTSQRFEASKESVEARLASLPKPARSAPSGNATVLVPGVAYEVLAAGRRQGATAKRASGEPLRASARSALCKLSMLDEFVRLLAALARSHHVLHDQGATSTSASATARTALLGWSYWQFKRQLPRRDQLLPPPPAPHEATTSTRLAADMTRSHDRSDGADALCSHTDLHHHHQHLDGHGYRQRKDAARGTSDEPDSLRAQRAQLHSFVARAEMGAVDRLRLREREQRGRHQQEPPRAPLGVDLATTASPLRAGAPPYRRRDDDDDEEVDAASGSGCEPAPTSTAAAALFAGWLVSGAEWESFDVRGRLVPRPPACLPPADDARD